MARGFCYLNIVSVTPTGSFIADPGNGYNLLGATTGGATFVIGGDDVYDLYDESNVFIGSYTLETLPDGFQFINEDIDFYTITYGYINNTLNSVYVASADDRTKNAAAPTCYYTDNLPDNGILNYTSDFGWTQDNLFFDDSVKQAYLMGFTLTINYVSNVGAMVIGVVIPDGTITSSPSFPGTIFPLNKFICAWDDEGTTGPTLGPVTGPILNTTTPAITVIPPANTTIITVTTPTTTITTNATPATPITVVLPPGTTVVTIVPMNPGVNPPGNPVIVPIDLDVESDGLVIDMAVASDIQLIGNPSGIYTLIPNQRFDVLYERAAGTTTTQTVQIPRPYGITSYVPEND